MTMDIDNIDYKYLYSVFIKEGIDILSNDFLEIYSEESTFLSQNSEEIDANYFNLVYPNQFKMLAKKHYRKIKSIDVDLVCANKNSVPVYIGLDTVIIFEIVAFRENKYVYEYDVGMTTLEFLIIPDSNTLINKNFHVSDLMMHNHIKTRLIGTIKLTAKTVDKYFFS
jgi:hypothetical protein